MSSRELKPSSQCTGGRHYGAAKAIEGDITSKGTKSLLANCFKVYRKNQGQLAIILLKKTV